MKKVIIVLAFVLIFILGIGIALQKTKSDKVLDQPKQTESEMTNTSESQLEGTAGKDIEDTEGTDTESNQEQPTEPEPAGLEVTEKIEVDIKDGEHMIVQ